MAFDPEVGPRGLDTREARIVRELEDPLRGKEAHRLIVLVEHCIPQMFAELDLDREIDAASEEIRFVGIGVLRLARRWRDEPKSDEERWLSQKAGGGSHGKLPLREHRSRPQFVDGRFSRGPRPLFMKLLTPY
jgi:hypothetical protein